MILPFKTSKCINSKRRIRRNFQRFSQFITYILIISLINHHHHHFQIVKTKRTPQKRNYELDQYYVIEIIPSAINIDPNEIVKSLGVEFIEKVGELDDFLLVKSSKSNVLKGFNEIEDFQKLKIRNNLKERDTVLERYEHYKNLYQSNNLMELEKLNRRRFNGIDKSAPSPLLSIRQSIRLIKAIDKQTLRKRNKRNLIYVPSSNGPLSKRAEEDYHQFKSSIQNRASPRTLSERLGLQFNIKDPLWPKQWHLANNEMRQHMINVTDVWSNGITGKNVTVAIVDDGLDMTSEDLKPNFFEAGSWDYNDHTPLPEPRLPDDLHGTRCAGEIAAIKNDVCGVGVAYDAKVAGIRILSASISDADEASALNFGYQENHIYSCSWGPPDDGKSMEAPSRLIFKAMLNGIQKGRGGKGSVFVFASGNGGAVDDQCNFDGYTNSIYSITISAVDRKGFHPYYSEVCSANMVVTYSSGSGDNIHTTDVGKNKCTDRHGGTSAAAPLGAGIFALVLEARPELTWRDVQHLAVETAVPILVSDPDWQKTATGKWYNHKFGFGNMDANLIVEAAKKWKLVKPQAWWKSPNMNAGKQPVTKEGAASVIEIKQSDLDGANFETLEHITVAVNIEHGRRGNVRVTLTSPHGTISVLAAHRRYDEATTGFPGWVFMTVKHWGEPAVGKWTLTVSDPHQTPGKNGTFQDWAMGIWGECKNPDIQELFKMPDDSEIILPGTPVSGVPLGTEEPETKPGTAIAIENKPTNLPNPPPVVEGVGIEDTYKTKSIARPTAHLPDDHAGMEDFVTGVGGMTSYFSSRSGWIFIAFGTLIILGGSVTGWMMLRRMSKRRRELDFSAVDDDDDDDDGVGLLSGGRRQVQSAGGILRKVVDDVTAVRGNGYGFEPVAGDEDLPMRTLERGRTKDGRGQTKELYDAFGNGSDDLSDQEDDDDFENAMESKGQGKENTEAYRDK
ncbi:hypothetical protein CROQUDRAFT_56154 [Cronartium quercuum f. sp. fusiforme G11]|uniref:P/Homo B domain-containing protein n=1 Tax=Cronartium quercuum f. sp. fusiforme G11 TaxID=708437 RepID=A0A9P6NTX8_9BASI|nr:hypothetical protein CROQUDRAFT_56154 [Cronartium quercuum f. sp. fusiforme G11]